MSADETREAIVDALRDARAEHEWPVETNEGIDWSRCNCGARPPLTLTAAEASLWLSEHHDTAVAYAVARETVTIGSDLHNRLNERGQWKQLRAGATDKGDAVSKAFALVSERIGETRRHLNYPPAQSPSGGDLRA